MERRLQNIERWSAATCQVRSSKRRIGDAQSPDRPDWETEDKRKQPSHGAEQAERLRRGCHMQLLFGAPHTHAYKTQEGLLSIQHNLITLPSNKTTLSKPTPDRPLHQSQTNPARNRNSSAHQYQLNYCKM